MTGGPTGSVCARVIRPLGSTEITAEADVLRLDLARRRTALAGLGPCDARRRWGASGLSLPPALADHSPASRQ
ncbi:hypothetical protein [Kribbella sp. CA-294648]|uniref:hypothetical protein n=1 Tax=Kribbella sp. CA-294648 TaxID=3239948 RepID=UPI003D93D022